MTTFCAYTAIRQGNLHYASPTTVRVSLDAVVFIEPGEDGKTSVFHLTDGSALEVSESGDNLKLPVQ
jgi:hypothetical protein